MRIRRFKEKDSIKASNIIKKGFQLSSSNYSEESIKEQIEENSPKKLIEKSKKINYFVATEKDKILGIGGYDRKKVYTLFVDPKYHRKGIGKKIIERVLSEAKMVGIKTLDTWSTFHAEKFYSSIGFKRIKKFTLKCKYSSIKFVLMRKKL
jgi:N-acetylglutamate synthase-like GNAT family acetyltransferase|tara:strand:+ start:612 stop:1064 length:453 start_codon:yes stop_codon:yes gene_type:complete